jgi:Zn-dependent protease with chaperone function
MSIASCLLLYSFVVAVLGPRMLPRFTRAGVSPRLGVATWLAAIGSVVASWIAAAVLLAGEVAQDAKHPGQSALSTCFALLRQAASGEDGVLAQIGLVALSTLATTAVTGLVWRMGRSLLRVRTATHQHARMARLVGRPVSGRDAVVLDAPERVAYCVAGRPHTVVVTSAALDALDERHLDAVLAHERAHLAGRHHLILALTRSLATILPTSALFRTGAAEVARLLEMCADDTAARAHGPATLLDALLSLCGAGPIPTGALGATGVSVLARAHRLATPPAPSRRWRIRLLLGTTAVVLLTGPVVTGMLAAAGLSWCDPILG